MIRRDFVPDFFEFFSEDVFFNRLDHVVAHLSHDGFQDLRFFAFSREQDERKVLPIGARADEFQKLESIHVRHVPVGDHKFKWCSRGFGSKESLISHSAIVGFGDVSEAESAQISLQEISKAWHIVNDENSRVRREHSISKYAAAQALRRKTKITVVRGFP